MKEDRTQFRVINGNVENNVFHINYEKTYDEDRDAASGFNTLVVNNDANHYARYNTYKLLEDISGTDGLLLIKPNQKILRVNLDVSNNDNMVLLIEVQQ